MLTNKWQEIEVTVVEIRPGVASKMFGWLQRSILDTGEELITVYMKALDSTFNIDYLVPGQKVKWVLKKGKPWGYIGYPLEPEHKQVIKPEAPRGKDVHRAAQRKEHENESK